MASRDERTWASERRSVDYVQRAQKLWKSNNTGMFRGSPVGMRDTFLKCHLARYQVIQHAFETGHYYMNTCNKPPSNAGR